MTDVSHAGCSRVQAVRRLLTALAVVSAGSAVAQGQVDPKIAEFCLKATDFAGCVQTMTGGLPPKQQKDAEEGLRTWTRDNGQVVRFRPASVQQVKNKGVYGRYLEYKYGLEGKDWDADWLVVGDCKDYTADWLKSGDGWYRVDDPDMYLKDGEPTRKYNSSTEAKAVLDEFCPIIDSLPKSSREI